MPRALIVAGLLGLSWWMAASVSREHSTTADEIFHITAGYSYWKFGDYRLQPENGNLPQRWAALPLLAQDLRFPDTGQPAWRLADVAFLGACTVVLYVISRPQPPLPANGIHSDT